MSPRFKSFLPTLILLVFLSGMGLFLHYFTDADVFWGGFVGMMVFYALIFYLGSYAAKLRSKGTLTDVMVAGRSIPLWIAVFTMSATWVGGGYINGSAEATYDSGLVWVQAPWGYALSLIIGGLVFAGPMRRLKFKTMLDPLEQRFGKRMAAVAFLPALLGEIFWTAAILTALGATFGTVLGVDFTTSILISAAIAIGYTSLGGLWAVALTDIAQLLLLFLGLGIVLPYALESAGGWSAAWDAYVINNGDTATFLPTEKALGDYYWQWWDYALLLIFGGIPWQVYFQRVLSARDPSTARRLSIMAGIVCIIAAIPAIMIGIVGDAFASPENWAAVGAGTGPANGAEVLPYVVRYLTNPVVATVGLGAIAAAVMSSVDSSILSASSMAGWNVYRPLFAPKITPEGLTKVLRKVIWIVGIAATLLALQIESVKELWYLCSDFVYCLLFPLLLTAIFDKKANYIGAAIGFGVALFLRLGGGDATLGLPQWLPYPVLEDGSVAIPFRTLAMACGLLTIVVVSRLTQGRAPARALQEMEE